MSDQGFCGHTHTSEVGVPHEGGVDRAGWQDIYTISYHGIMKYDMILSYVFHIFHPCGQAHT